MGSSGIAMSNDAKLGLVLGVAIVLVIGLVFFRADPLAATGPSKNSNPMTVLPKGNPADPAAATRAPAVNP